MKESNIEKYLHKQLTKIGGTTRKWVSPGRNGVPDQIVFYAGTVIFVETKFSKNGLSPVQKRQHLKLMEAGATIHLCRTFHSVDQLVLDLVKNA